MIYDTPQHLNTRAVLACLITMTLMGHAVLEAEVAHPARHALVRKEWILADGADEHERGGHGVCRVDDVDGGYLI